MNSTCPCRQIEREMNVQALLHHPHILQIYGAFEDDTFVYLVQQLADRGDVYRAVLAPRLRLTEPQIVTLIMVPLLQALDHAHEVGVIHR
jgi:serine/threonine protein kinase